MLYRVPTIELWFARIIFTQIYGLLVVTSRFRFENNNNWCYNKILDGEIIIKYLLSHIMIYNGTW